MVLSNLLMRVGRRRRRSYKCRRWARSCPWVSEHSGWRKKKCTKSRCKILLIDSWKFTYIRALQPCLLKNCIDFLLKKSMIHFHEEFQSHKPMPAPFKRINIASVGGTTLQRTKYGYSYLVDKERTQTTTSFSQFRMGFWLPSLGMDSYTLHSEVSFKSAERSARVASRG